MKMKLTQYKNGVQITAKLHNRKIYVLRTNEGEYKFMFRRLDNSLGAILEENTYKNIFDVYINLSNEAALCLCDAIRNIEIYVTNNNL